MTADLRHSARVLGAVAARELRVELRVRSALQGVFFFAGLAVLLFSFAVGPSSEELRRFAPGLLWLAIALASLLAVGRSFAAERDLGTLEGLLLLPVPRELLFLGKLLTGFALMLVLAASALVLMTLLYALPAPEAPLALVAALALGALGLATAGTFYGAVSAQVAAREALMPMLLLPVLVPLMIAATRATDAALAGGDALGWLGVLTAYDAVLMTLGIVVIPHLLDP